MLNYNNSKTPENEKDLAQTPWPIVRAAEKLIGVRFVLDVCAIKETAKAANYYSITEGQDGLELPWMLFNWCNPPFSNILPWMEKAVLETKRGFHTMMIFPDRPETAYSRYAFDKAQCLIRLPKRVKFLRPDGTEFLDKYGKISSPKFSCVLAYFTSIGCATPTSVTYIDLDVLRMEKDER